MHSPLKDIDEKAVSISVYTLINYIVDFLKSRKARTLHIKKGVIRDILQLDEKRNRNFLGVSVEYVVQWMKYLLSICATDYVRSAKGVDYMIDFEEDPLWREIKKLVHFYVSIEQEDVAKTTCSMMLLNNLRQPSGAQRLMDKFISIADLEDVEYYLIKNGTKITNKKLQKLLWIYQK